MITNKELFKEKNMTLFMPDGVEYIYSILQNTGFTDFTTIEARDYGLSIVEKLLDLNLIEVFHWGNDHLILKDKKKSNVEICNLLEQTWFKGADFKDFFGMFMFKYKNWYLKSLKKEGFTDTTNWQIFVKEKILNLEQWIEANQPKEVE